MASDVKTKDMDLWRKWKKSKDPQDLQLLLNQMKPIIMREVNRWSNSMSRSLLEAEGARLTVEAFQSYDPSQGAALSTYVASRLPKLSRIVYATQNTARLSETKALLFHTYNTALNQLRDTHGRDPTSEELADHLAWSPKKLQQFQTQAGRKEFVESEEHPEDELAEDHLVDYIYHDLTPMQKQIFEYRVGYLGHERLQDKEIMRKLKLTQGQLSYQVSQIHDLIKAAKKSA